MTARSQAELERLVSEQVDILRAHCVAYDGGLVAMAKPIAVSLRVLLHDTAASHALLQQVGVLSSLRFLDTCTPDPGSLTWPGLVFLMMSTAGSEYRARLDRAEVFSREPVEHWWTTPVDDRGRSRRSYVLALANREGGAHVDPQRDRVVDGLDGGTDLGWHDLTTGELIVSPVVGPCVRQVAWEVEHTLIEQVPGLVSRSA